LSVAYSRLLRRAFDLYLDYSFRRTFEQIVIRCRSKTVDFDPHLPLIFVANHCSWWDGFFLAKLQRSFAPKASLYSLMLEEELKRRPFFRRLGAVGIRPQDPFSVLSSFYRLREASRSSRMREEPICISIFPQGSIRPQAERPLNFKPGVERLTRFMGSAQLLPIALCIEPLRAVKPTALVLAGDVVRVNRGDWVSSKVLAESVQTLLDIDAVKLASDLLYPEMT
jgi:1-acyl-sn-glycerol-3-phosphate acyltransferase